MKKCLNLLAVSLGITGFVGCSQDRVAEFEPNMVAAYSSELSTGYPMQQALDETQVALQDYFGTPDQPKIPSLNEEEFGEDYKSLVSMENLVRSSGSPVESGRGLYRVHCATCHGLTGNGRGETAALLDPYPRDYRLGKFKFKSTLRGAKPLREDLVYSIKHGISGTSMKAIPELTDEDIEALVDYVIYLSWRGEFERAMLMEGEDIEFEVDEEGEGGEHLYAPESGESFAEQQELAEELIADIADSWLEAEDRLKEVPDPGDVPVPETIQEVVDAANSSEASPLKESIEKGRVLFASETAACGKCHGKEGYGDGQTQDYDDWTKEWTQRIGIDPQDSEAQIPLLARGALPPRKILPRDFRAGLYRGGSEPEHIYQRIAFGIDGTPMPAASLTPEEIWHLVNYVRSLSQPAETATESPTEAVAQTDAK